MNVLKLLKVALQSSHWQVTTSGLGAVFAGGPPPRVGETEREFAGCWVLSWHSANADGVLSRDDGLPEKEGESGPREGKKLYRQ